MTGTAFLLLGLAGLCAIGGLAACSLRLDSAVEFILGTYVVAWAWLVGVVLLLSPARLLTRAWLTSSIALGVLVALGGWLGVGRPGPPPFFRLRRSVFQALQPLVVRLLAVVVVAGAAYSAALAFLTPVDEGDALAYHLARAAFWGQHHGLSYVANASDLRIDVDPPNAEIGSLATMLLAGVDRYVALPQFLAYGVLVLCVGALSRRLGFDASAAAFGALLFATLPVVVLQASGALNDLLVASFLAVAALFAVERSTKSLVLAGLALALAIGTKFTAILALPVLVAWVLANRPGRRLLALAAAAALGLALGSSWIVVNLVKTGHAEGGLAESGAQRAGVSAAGLAASAMRYGLSLFDLSGAAWPSTVLFLGIGLALAGLALARVPADVGQARILLRASLLAASVLLIALVAKVGERLAVHSWNLLGQPNRTALAHRWETNFTADAATSWYGPVGLVLILGVPVAIALNRRRWGLSTAVFVASLAPLILVGTLLVTLSWDPFRGRFVIFGVALAASTWGLVLRSATVRAAVAAVAIASLVLALANDQGKPSGWMSWRTSDDPRAVATSSVWGAPRATVQTWLRPGTSEVDVVRLAGRMIPANAHVALALQPNDFVYPYFGPRLSRHVEFVGDSGNVPADSRWLIVHGSFRPRCAPGGWNTELSLRGHWRIARRAAANRC